MIFELLSDHAVAGAEPDYPIGRFIFIFLATDIRNKEGFKNHPRNKFDLNSWFRNEKPFHGLRPSTKEEQAASRENRAGGKTNNEAHGSQTPSHRVFRNLDRALHSVLEIEFRRADFRGEKMALKWTAVHEGLSTTSSKIMLRIDLVIYPAWQRRMKE